MLTRSRFHLTDLYTTDTLIRFSLLLLTFPSSLICRESRISRFLISVLKRDFIIPFNIAPVCRAFRIYLLAFSFFFFLFYFLFFFSPVMYQLLLQKFSRHTTERNLSPPPPPLIPMPSAIQWNVRNKMCPLYIFIRYICVRIRPFLLPTHKSYIPVCIEGT